MAFFQQLKLLLWKNGLAVIRRPVWSLTLITWPLVIFIILAVTRYQFPPIVRETCYVGPRNLPSTGLFPFLQTLMCNTDSSCHNTSRLVEPASSKSRRARSVTESSPLESLGQVGDFLNLLPNDFTNDHAELVKLLDNLGTSHHGSPKNAPVTTFFNSTEDQENLDNMLESANLLKRGICTVTLPMLNESSLDVFTNAVFTFCKTNNTVFEVSLYTVNQILEEWMLTQPEEMMEVAWVTVTFLNQLQNDNLLWERLLALPQLFSDGSVDQMLRTLEDVLKHLQGDAYTIEEDFPKTSGPFSKYDSFLAEAIRVITYINHWPGKNVTIPLGKLVTNDSLGTTVKYLVENVLDYEIPLDKAFGLMLDKDLVRSYLCDNSSNILWSATACSSGIVDKVLSVISTEKVAKQVFLAWIKEVAKHDVLFVRGLVYNLTGDFSSGESEASNITRTRRSSDAEPQNAEEELFLNIGQTALELVQNVPEVNTVVQGILRTGYQSMKLASETIDMLKDILENVLEDANNLQMTYHTLLTNQSESHALMDRVLNSVMEVVMKVMSTEDVKCEEVLASLDWLLSINSIKTEVWTALICPNNGSLQQALLMDWEDLIEKGQDLYSSLTGKADFNITLPMILSEWQELNEESFEFTELLTKMTEKLDEEYWMNWTPDNNTQFASGALQKSLVWFMISLGERIENSDQWPPVKDYFHIAYWILNYHPDVTTQPANCSLNKNLALHCDTGFDWPHFVQAMTQALMSPSDALVNCLKGSVNLLQHVYGEIYTNETAVYLKQEIKGGDALSDYLINLMHNLDEFLSTISQLPNQNITNPATMTINIHALLESTGLSSLVPLLSQESPLNASTILAVASKLGRLSQHIFTFNETDPTLPELEKLIREFLSLEGNLTLSLPNIMGHTLLTYSDYFHSDEADSLIKAIEPFTNQTSVGFVEAIISAVELFKTVMDSPNGDPTEIILGYIRQIQEFVVSLYRLRRIEHVVLPSGQYSTAQVTDLHLLSMDFLNLLTPETLQNLTQAGPDAAQDIVIQKFVAFLPKEIQSDAAQFLQDFKALQSNITKCAAGEDCLAGFSEISKFLDQILDMMLTANGTVTIKVAPFGLGDKEYENTACLVFSLLLSPNDNASLETFKQTLQFIKLVMNTPNVTVSDVQNALTQTNLTIEDLNAIAELAGASDINKLMSNIIGIANVESCFEPQNDIMLTTKCVTGLIDMFSSFLTQVPSLHNNTDILSLIPVIVNKTINDFTQVNFNSGPNMVLVDSLDLTLTNIKMSLDQSHLNTPEIMNEIQVVEGLIQLIADMHPVNTSQMTDPVQVQTVYLKLVEWYLKRLENITSDSATAELLHPFFSITQMQVALQLAQTNFSLFVSDKVQFLINSLQGPIDGTVVSEIGQTATEILQHLLDLIEVNLESWSNTEGSEQQLNATILHSTELQIKQYLGLIEKWMTEPNVTLLLSSMLQWENSTIATPVTDLQYILQTVENFLSDDQLAYLSIMNNITESLSKAVMVAEQQGLQDESFIAAIVEVVQHAIQIPNITVIPLPQQDFLDIVQESVNLIVQPNMSFASAKNISIVILEKVERIIQQTVPEMVAEYMLGSLKFVKTYFETISEASGQDNLNQIIFNEMKTLQSLLSQQSPVQPYISALINITQVILESGQGKMNLWAGFENASADNAQQIVQQLGKLVSMFWPLVADGTGSHMTAPNLEAFTQLVPVLETILTGNADQDTWNKLEQVLGTLLSTLEGTELLDNLTSVIPQFEKMVGTLVENIQAGNVMIQSLQIPILNLMRETAQSLNNTHYNFSEVLEKFQVAIESTVQAAQQANGTLECSEVLKVWETFSEAAGLSPNTMAVWCNISLQPVLEAYASAQNLYSQMNMSQTIMGPTNVSDTAARIVETAKSLYQVNINNILVINQLVMNFSNHLSMLVEQSMSPEAQLYWQNQLQDMQLQNSLSSIKMLSDELHNVAPALQPYMDALMNATGYILDNYQLLQQSTSAEELLKEAAMHFLSSANMSSYDIFSTTAGNTTASLYDLTTEMIRQMINIKAFGDDPMIYQVLEEFLRSNDTNLIAEKVAELSVWLNSTEASGIDLLSEALFRSYDIVRPVLSALAKMNTDMQATVELLEDLVGNSIAMFRQLVSTGNVPDPMVQYLSDSEMTDGYHTHLVRRRRDASLMMTDPMNDFIDLFYIDYPTMFKAMAVPPTTPEIMETAHVFFANPDLSVVMKGATSGMQWGLNASQEETVDAALGVLSFLTLPDVFEKSSMDLLKNAVDMLPDALPYSSVIKNFTRALANESQENMMLVQQIIRTAGQLFQILPTDPQFKENLDLLRVLVCMLEDTETVHLLMQSLNIESGQLCNTFLPSLEVIIEGLVMNTTSLVDIFYQTVIGDPRSYNVHTDWSAVLSQTLGFNISSVSSLNINSTSSRVMTFGEMLKNKTDFVLDVQQYMDLDPATLDLLMNSTLPNNNLVILSWLLNLRHCPSTPLANMEEADLMNTFCSLSVEQWYTLSLLMTRHLNIEQVLYKMVLSDDIQTVVGIMVWVAEAITDMMDKMLPAINQLQIYLNNIKNLNLTAKNQPHPVRQRRSATSSAGSFVTLSRALCSNGIKALFGISKLPLVKESDPSITNNPQREEMIERFKIPRNATPFCMNMYLDMVNTTGGAIAWAFLKPMLMGQILYTPDTPSTRAIIEKANATLQDFANVRQYSEDWIKSSKYLFTSANKLKKTLPMLQNSLGNPFVKNFIQRLTGIDVDRMQETLSSFSNMTLMLEKNKEIVDHINTLSTLMVDISSCIKFDRYRGFDSADELNSAAQELAKNRDLYGSVIFKLPKDADSSRNKREATTSLPPEVSYTIRMHMDNVMRTDRARNRFFVKESYISSRKTMRYNRGFIYLQESIDRAIIETQTGQKAKETAVQLQPFPYPCYHRDEYLEAISFVFPLMLMVAWVLFIADFVKKLVHERELRLHEYMKMMGVNTLSHFFAWFVECFIYLLVTIIIMTLVLKHGKILPNSDSFLIFLYLCDYGLSILAFSYLVSSFFDKTYIAGLSGSLLYILCFFPFIIVTALEGSLTLMQKSALGLFSPTCFSYASQYMSRYEAQGEGIQWSNSYSSPIAGDTASFGWLCWLMLIDSILYFTIGAYIRTVFPGKYGIPAPWYFPFKLSFWADLCCVRPKKNTAKGLLFSNIMQNDQLAFSNDKGKGKSALSTKTGEDFSELPVGVALHGLTKTYGDQAAIQNLNVSFYEGHVTSLLGHNGAGKTTTMSLLTGLFAPSSGTIEVYGRDMQTNIENVRRELGVCMQYDVLFDHMTTKEHLLLYGQIKAPHWSDRELHEQVRTILEDTGMYAHRHKRVGTLSGGMKRKLSISIAFIGGSRVVVLDEPTTGVDPCSRRNIWDIVIQHKKNRTIIMSTHHLDEAEVLSDRIAFLEKGGLKCCGSPFYLKEKLGQGYKLTLTKKVQKTEDKQIDSAEVKAFVQAHVPEARLKEAQGNDLVYSLPPFNSSNASSYRSLLTALDSNLDALQLGGYGISDTTLEEVFLQLTHGQTEAKAEDGLPSISETVSDTISIDSLSLDDSDSSTSFSDRIKLTSSSTVTGMALAWQQMSAILIKRFHHSRRDWKGLISQILLPVLFVVFAMSLGSIKSDVQHYPELQLSPALYKIGPSYSFFSNQNPNSQRLADTMMSFPGMDTTCLDKRDNLDCTRNTNKWSSSGNSSKGFNICKCTQKEQICDKDNYQPPHTEIPSSQIVYDLNGINVENYLVSTANDFIRNRYGGFAFGMPLPADLKMDITAVPENRTLSKVWFNPEGHHTMPAYLNSLNNFILRANLPADKDPRKYAISVYSQPYFGRADDEDVVVQGLLHILVAMCVLTGFSITTASFAIYEVTEHQKGSKRLQHIAGISESFYWIVNFIYDMVIYLVPVAATVAVIAAFQIPAFTERQNLGAVTLLLVLFGFSTFPWMYLFAGIFRDAEMAFISYVCINLFISVNTILTTCILYFLGQISMRNPEAIQEIFQKLSYAFLIFPQFSFGNGLMELARGDIEVQILSGYGVDAYKNPFSTEGLGWMFISSIIQGLVFFTLRLLINKSLMRKVRRLICYIKTVPQAAYDDDQDEDVVSEHLRVASGAASSDILQVNRLTKIYQHLSKKVHAVKNLSVGIPAGECFGLLGVNGAGKTTTFKMLTGDVSPTDGTAQIKDWDGRLVDIMECRKQGINIGYCPQVDALDDLLTGEEHLYFYARIRGVSKWETDRLVNYLLKRLQLNYHRNIITDGYSCGTRRKLSTALALIGNPQILLLDEPSSGMDPRTKRHLWKIISEEVKGKCAVVLTSHSMEECEALCSRLAIMVKGQFRCLGSLQHIKNRFGSGFTVKMYLAEASCDVGKITSFMQRRFPSTYLKDQHSTVVEYHVPFAPGGLADIFDQLESNKNALQIKHFSVSQTTLDEVFINFAMGKIGMETIPIDAEDENEVQA
ncbi:LOW QUALITY PROTEIN: ATP-binding cassette sub-family A member 12 [Oreochromis niloticus]|uniref:LOW QUALITY PROTEIN: ATP-binding cassette sub-family A member 12 n=1 Tax=Oreochromis niloticus TaxID=8128 RepID=UPI00022B703A|nr:LOW QUALITY PROTEIN: ATP-binding cassette sub-family A member 12 [Oreochromis niloticus]